MFSILFRVISITSVMVLISNASVVSRQGSQCKYLQHTNQWTATNLGMWGWDRGDGQWKGGRMVDIKFH